MYNAARANHHVPHWCCILAEVVYGTVATRSVPLSTTAAVAAMVAFCTWCYVGARLMSALSVQRSVGFVISHSAYSEIVLSSLARYVDTSVRQPAVTRTLKPCPSRVPALWRFADCSVPLARSGLYRSLRHLVFLCDQVRGGPRRADVCIL